MKILGRIQFRSDTAANWTAANPTLLIGEFGHESDTGQFKVGDGSTAWNSLAYTTGPVGPAGGTGPIGPQGIQGIPGPNLISVDTDSDFADGVLISSATGLNIVPFTGSATDFLNGAGNFAVPSGTGGVTDGDKGDVTVSGGGLTWTIDNKAVTYAKIQDVSATARILGRNTAGAGSMEELNASTVKTILSLGSVENTALSTWAGSSNITTLGTIATGVWNGAAISKSKLSGLDKFEITEASVASASTCDIGSASSDNVLITGTTGITSFGTGTAGIRRYVRFSGALTITHNATSLILPTSANITTVAGDALIAECIGSGNWKVLVYQRQDGTPLAGGGSGSSPTTTRGDLIVRGASVDQRLAIGTRGYSLLSDGTDPLWALDDGFVFSQNRSGIFWTVGATSSTFSTQGDSVTANGTPSNSNVSSTQPAMIACTSGAVAGNAAGHYGGTYTAPRQQPKVFAIILIPDSSSARIWVSLHDGTSTTGTNSDTPTSRSLMGFRYSTDASDPNWMCCTNDGTGPLNVIDSGVAITGNVTVLAMNHTGSSVKFYINGSLVATSSSSLPSANVACRLQLYIETRTAAARTIRSHAAGIIKNF